MSDLFSSAPNKNEPLAFRMRPRTLDEYIGQEHILGKGRLLRRAIQADQLSSVIFYGPPGTGKTTLARVIANTTKSHFSTLNAVLSGVKELRDEIAAARERRDHFGMRTILFIDEVHRWNKSQQDALLPWVENGTLILIGATTENPFFEVNAALVSRSRIFQLKSLTDENLREIAEQAISDKERGYGRYRIEFEPGALEHLIDVSSGDARTLLNALELAVETTPDSFPPPDGTVIYISRETAEESIQKKAVLYDKEGDYHFDVISAFIKSIRGSDPDASLYWLARMVSAGEDPRFIFRRMLISAAEDIGLAAPDAVSIVEADASAFDRIGLPEGRFHLTHAALYLATCPKSNSAIGFFDALSDVEKEKDGEVPNHLRDASRDKEGFGHGEGYLYPHSYRDHWVAQQYLPSGLQGKVYYRPTSMGYESEIKDDVLMRRESQLEAVSDDSYREILTFSPDDRDRSRWIDRAISGRASALLSSVSRLYEGIAVERHSNILVLNASHGLMLWPLMKRNPEGLSAVQVVNEEQRSIIEHFVSELDSLSKPQLYVCSAIDVFSRLEEGTRFRVISGRNCLSYLNESAPIAGELKRWLEPEGQISLIEAIPSLSSRLSDFAEDKIMQSHLLDAERIIYGSPLASWGRLELSDFIDKELPGATIEYEDCIEDRRFSEHNLRSWFANSYRDCGITEDAFVSAFINKTVRWRNATALIRYGYCEEEKDYDGSEWKRIHQITHQ